MIDREDSCRSIQPAAAGRLPCERVVTARTHAACPFSIATEYAVAYLGAARADRIVLRTMQMSFGVQVDPDERGRPHDEIRMRWISGTSPVPAYQGKIRFRIDGLGTLVIAELSYVPPYGAIGRVLDRFVIERITRNRVTDLAGRVARSLEERERDWLQRMAFASRGEFPERAALS